MVLPLEIVAATLTIDYWTDGRINNDAWVALFLGLIIAINLFGVRGYGEAEFVFAIIKVAAIIGFIIVGIVINVGGTGPQGYIGGRYWYDPGAFHNGFKVGSIGVGNRRGSRPLTAGRAFARCLQSLRSPLRARSLWG